MKEKPCRGGSKIMQQFKQETDTMERSEWGEGGNRGKCTKLKDKAVHLRSICLTKRVTMNGDIKCHAM